jgi:hypothetical protein
LGRDSEIQLDGDDELQLVEGISILTTHRDIIGGNIVGFDLFKLVDAGEELGYQFESYKEHSVILH